MQPPIFYRRCIFADTTLPKIHTSSLRIRPLLSFPLHQYRTEWPVTLHIGRFSLTAPFFARRRPRSYGGAETDWLCRGRRQRFLVSLSPVAPTDPHLWVYSGDLTAPAMWTWQSLAPPPMLRNREELPTRI